jgi:hypothetical protein
MRVVRKPDRRAAQRWEVVFGLTGQAVGSRVTLVNVSDGGFLVRAREVFTVGDTHQVQFRSPHAGPRHVTVMARVVHVTPLPWLFSDTHLIGFEFERESKTEHAKAIERLVQDSRAVDARSKQTRQ